MDSESGCKSWVRLLPPRRMYDGAALCGYHRDEPGDHARLEFEHRRDTRKFATRFRLHVAGPGLIGYYIEEDRELAPEERLRFSPGETISGAAGVLPTVDPRRSTTRQRLNTTTHWSTHAR